MADKHTKAQRSHNMSRVRSSKTKPELRIRKLMHGLGFTYQPKNIFGKPDYARRKNKLALFIDGCFWHACPTHYSCPSSNVSFWKVKIAANRKRDLKVNRALRKDGWKVIRIWEHDLR